MKYLWLKTVNGDEYQMKMTHENEAEMSEEYLKSLETLFKNFANLNYLSLQDPTLFTKDGDVEEIKGTVYLNPNNVIHAYWK